MLEAEEKMWNEGILDESNSKQLFKTIMYLVGLHCVLRGGEEHRNLWRPGHNSQFEISADRDGQKCLKYCEDPKSKTNQGGVGSRNHLPRTVHIYPEENSERCLV